MGLTITYTGGNIDDGSVDVVYKFDRPYQEMTDKERYEMRLWVANHIMNATESVTIRARQSSMLRLEPNVDIVPIDSPDEWIGTTEELIRKIREYKEAYPGYPVNEDYLCLKSLKKETSTPSK